MDSRMLLMILLYLLVNLEGSLCQNQENVNSEMCSNHERCGACIQAQGCVWCSQKDFNRARCMMASSQLGSSCPPEYVINPQATETVIADIPLGKSTSSSLVQKLVQIRPQQVRLKLRVGETYDLKFEYKQAEDFPVDLYYLMDLSGSMEDDKENLSKLGDKLAEAMKLITSNFRIGFGSFVDKVAMPFVSTVPHRLARPCTGTTSCVGPYSFKNHMPLSNSTSEFSKMVKEAEISGNLDSPEGGFDALMQAMVCKEIGWRPSARHLLVFSTDASFHLAGDGKLAGVVEPNDGKCHMVEKNGVGMLSKAASLEYDYPSISQLDQKAQENNINLILAVTKEYGDLYKKLQDRIKGASSGTLSGDSSNVIQLVQSEYQKLVNSVKLIEINDDVVEVRYFTKCLNISGEERHTKECAGIRVNNTVQFTAKIKVLSCPEDPKDWKRTLSIKPEGLNENVLIEIEIICDCPCENPGDLGYKETSEECHGGSLQCGVCDCSNTGGLVGHHCECAANSVQIEDVATCQEPNSNKTCSDRGQCKCGMCECRERAPGQKFSGPFCQCDDYSCPRSNNQVCSGLLHGDCVCGECKCKNNWAGKECNCKNVTDTCIAPKSSLICSGRGTCNCGKCDCDESESKSRYSPPFCEDCPSCPSQRCQELEQCVACQAYNKDSTNKECNKCKLQNIVIVDTLGDADMTKDEHKCTSIDEKGCTFEFIYKYENNIDIIRAQKQTEKDCKEKLNVLVLVLSVSGSTVIIGLLLLVAWKVLTTLHDRREYVKFEKERALSKFDRGDNPLYKPSTVTFSNPTFGN